jgi:hypothetical protein
VSNDNEPATLAELKAANRELTESLERCHALVAEYREILATNDEDTSSIGANRKGN